MEEIYRRRLDRAADDAEVFDFDPDVCDTESSSEKSLAFGAPFGDARPRVSGLFNFLFV